MNSNQDAVCKIIIVIICAIIAITGFLTLWSENKSLMVENELLKTELKDYDNTTEVFPHYCVKCYCKDICVEAANELKEMEGDD